MISHLQGYQKNISSLINSTNTPPLLPPHQTANTHNNNNNNNRDNKSIQPPPANLFTSTSSSTMLPPKVLPRNAPPKSTFEIGTRMPPSMKPSKSSYIY
jgi:hypothetical protein